MKVPAARTVGGLVVGLILGAGITLALQGTALEPGRPGRGVPTSAPDPAGTPERPDTFLAWVPGGLPPGFAAGVSTLPRIGRVVAVAEDNVWLASSTAADGHRVDHPPAPFLIPIDAAAVTPQAFAPFLPPVERDLTVALADGDGIFGATSAELRGLGPGATMTFDTGATIRIAAIVPDELVGAAELLVSRKAGAAIGIGTDRYLLLQPSSVRLPTSASLIQRLRPLLPATGSPPHRAVQVRAPGETPYFRQGDAVLPPVILKSLFGEFAARPVPGDPGFLQVDPAWVRDHITTTSIPLLGKVTCNRAIVPQLRGAMRELQAEGLGSLIRTYHGCYVPRFVNRVPTASISHHTWGVAFDVNVVGNAFGDPPHQDPRLVATLRRWGFTWGGSWIVPDGNHFEYARPAT